jgi:hypothetical protein
MLLTVRERLKEAARNQRLAKVKESEISSNPEDRPPATAGQQWVSANILYFTSEYTGDIRWTYYRIHISYIKRIRDIPNDEFEQLYLNDSGISEFHESLLDFIPTYVTYNLLKTKINTSSLNLNVKGIFKHNQTILTPTPLYPSFFGNTVAHTNNKIAGYKTTSIFTSPAINTSINPQSCS